MKSQSLVQNLTPNGRDQGHVTIFFKFWSSHHICETGEAKRFEFGIYIDCDQCKRIHVA